MKHTAFFIASLAMAASALQAGAEREPIRYGDFSNWYTRDIKESSVLGGKTKRVYEIAPAGHTTGNKPYVNRGGSPWATSNVYAKVSGIVKSANAVEPAVIGGNKVAKMSTIMEHVKGLGIINMDVIVQGTIFLGRIYEPITSTKTPFSKMEMGMPYTRKPLSSTTASTCPRPTPA